MHYKTPNVYHYDIFDNVLEQIHTLIAGKTGSGKSNCVDGIMQSIMRFAPNQKQVILIDPKRIELDMYAKIPHCIKYASEPEQMYKALLYTMDLCETRYKRMKRKHLRMYNGTDIYVIIDELNDLLTTDGKRITPIIQRLGQIARASKIHLICCTQKPTTDCIPSRITANLDARIGLRTRSKQESINILGCTGCETLPEIGYAYYMTPKQFTLYRIPKIDNTALLKHWTHKIHYLRL